MASGWINHGALNSTVGCALLIIGFASGGWLDPWSMAERDPAELWQTGRMLVRHAQAVVLASAFLQLGVGLVLAEAKFAGRLVTVSAVLVACGSIVYDLGWVAGILWPRVLWLAPSGAALSFSALAALLFHSGARMGWLLRVALMVFCFGMLLDAGMALFAVDPVRFAPDYLGGVDGVRMRMLRLARAAVIALTFLALLFHRLRWQRPASTKSPALLRWGEVSLMAGAIGMPALLVLAATIELRLKYLLGLPAQLVLAGVLIACGVALRRDMRFAALGWGLVGLSMTVGMLMGLYAFEGPLPVPEFLGQYNDFSRRVARLGHAYWIVQGLTAILIAGAAGQARLAGHSQRRYRFAMGLLTSGVLAMTAAIATATQFAAAVNWLGVGALLSAAAVACICDRFARLESPAAGPT